MWCNYFHVNGTVYTRQSSYLPTLLDFVGPRKRS